MLRTFKILQQLKITKSRPIRPLPAQHGNKQINPHTHTLIQPQYYLYRCCGACVPLKLCSRVEDSNVGFSLEEEKSGHVYRVILVL